MTIPIYDRYQNMIEHPLDEGYDRQPAYLALKTTLGAATIYFVYSSSLLPFILGFFAGGITVTIFAIYMIGSASIEGWEAILNLFDRLRVNKLLTKQNLIKLATDLLMFKLSQKEIQSESPSEVEQPKTTLDNLFKPSDVLDKVIDNEPIIIGKCARKEQEVTDKMCVYCGLPMSDPIYIEGIVLHELCINKFGNGGKECHSCKNRIVYFKHLASFEGRSYHKSCLPNDPIVCGKCVHISPTEGCCADKKASQNVVVGPSAKLPEKCCFCGTQCPSNERLHGKPFHKNCKDVFISGRFTCHGCYMEVINVETMENRNNKLYHRDCLPSDK